MLYRFLAESLLVLHLGFVAFAVLGGLLLLRWRSAWWLHLPAALWSVLIMAYGWTCPLTPLENRMRVLAGQSGYEGGFIEHYLLTVLYPAGLTREIQVLLGLAVLAINVAVYGYVVLKHRRAKRGEALRTREKPLGAGA